MFISYLHIQTYVYEVYKQQYNEHIHSILYNIIYFGILELYNKYVNTPLFDCIIDEMI